MPRFVSGYRSRRGKRPAKGGICEKYRSAKVVYLKRAVAEWDRQVMQAKHPEFIFEAFRCRSCDRWHVGRRTIGGEYVLAEDAIPPPT